MPGGDNTGPAGTGPMTGRGAGYCNGNEQPGFENTRSEGGFGRGRGRRLGRGGGRGGGRGRGRGGGRGFGWCGGRGTSWNLEQDGDRPSQPRMAAPNPQEIDALKRRAEDVSLALEALQARIRELESGEPEPK